MARPARQSPSGGERWDLLRDLFDEDFEEPPGPPSQVRVRSSPPVAEPPPVEPFLARLATRTRPATARLGRPAFLPGPYLALAAIGAALAFVFIRFTVDDAFITWRYGLTFAETGRWDFNPGTLPRVEGYTNFLFAALSIVPAFLHIPVELFFKVVALGLVAGYVHAAHRAELPRGQKIVLLAVGLCNPAFMVHVFSGLETGLFALVTALLFVLVYRDGRLGLGGYGLALVLALTRPEGVVLAGVAMAWSFVVTRRRAQIVGFVAVIGAWSAYWLARWAYFGYFWPNTFYVKSGRQGPVANRLADAVGALAPALVATAIVALLAAWVRWVRKPGGWGTWGDAQDATPAVLAATSAAIILGLYHGSDLLTNPVNRFQWQLLFPVAVVAMSRPLWPTSTDPADRMGGADPADRAGMPAPGLWVLAALVIAATASVADVPSRVGASILVTGAVLTMAAAVVLRWGVDRPKATVVAAAGLVVLVSWAPFSELRAWAVYRTRLHFAHEALGRIIAAAPFPGAIAINDAGILPFETSKPAFDLGGLANVDIAHGRFDEADLKAAGLTLVVAQSRTSAAGTQWIAGADTVAYRYMVDTGFISSAGPPHNYGYWLNYWIDPKWASPEMGQAVRQAQARAEKENLRTDSDVFWRNLFRLPFLSGGP